MKTLEFGAPVPPKTPQTKPTMPQVPAVRRGRYSIIAPRQS